MKASQTHICSELFRKHCPGKLFEIDDVLIQKKRNYNYVEKTPRVNYPGKVSHLKGLMIIRKIPVIHVWWMTPLLT